MSHKIRHDLTFLHEQSETPLIVGNLGGINDGCSRHPELVHHDAVYAIDAAGPLAADELAPNVIALSVGERETVATLNARTKELGHLLEDGRNYSVHKGAEASILLGRISGQVSASKPQNVKAYHEAFNRVTTGRGGQVPVMDAAFIYGSGGSSNGTGPPTENAVLHPWRSSAAAMTVERIRLGYIVNKDVKSNNHLRDNHAAGTVEAIGWLRTTEFEQETRLLAISELPSCGKNRAKRRRHASTFTQSYLAEDVRQHLSEYRNTLTENSAGRIAILKNGDFMPIMPHTVANEAERQYRPELEALKRAPVIAGAVVEPLALDWSSEKSENAIGFVDLMALLKRSQGNTVKSLVTLASHSPLTFRVTGKMRLEGHPQIQLAKLDRYLDSLGTGFGAFKTKRTVVAAMLKEVGTLIAKTKTLHGKAQRHLARRVVSLACVLVWFFAVSGLTLARLLVMATPLKWRGSMLQRSFNKLAAAATEFARLSASLIFLAATQARLAQEQQRMGDQLDSAIQSLDKFHDFTMTNAKPLVTMQPLEKAWRGLIQFHPNDVALNCSSFARLGLYVTATGLKTILGADDCDPETLVNTAFKAEPAWAPVVGNNNTRSYDDKLVIFPRVDGALREALETQATVLAGTADGQQLFFADTCVQVNVCKIFVSTPSPFEEGGIAEILSGDLLEGFKATLDPNRFRDFYPERQSLVAAKWVAEQLTLEFPQAMQRALEEAEAVKKKFVESKPKKKISQIERRSVANGKM